MTYKTDGNGAADSSLANYKRLRIGDIAFEGHTSKEFRYGRFVLNDAGDGIMSPRFSALRPHTQMPTTFWKYYIHYEPIMRKVLVNSTKAGTMMNELVVDEFLKSSLYVPSKEEQACIGGYFTTLDHLITLHQCKCHLLFKLLHNDWEQRKLLDCIQKITDFRGRTPKKLGMDWSEEGYLALSALNVKDGYIDFNQDVHYGNQELYDKWMTGNELHKGQVLFTTEAPMGNVAQVPDNRRYILSQRTIAFEVKNKLITENFLATVLRTPTVFTDLTALSSGGTAKGVSQKSLASVEIRLPKDLNEQEKIANTFYNLDHLITLHQRKCEETKKLKKYMLQKLFPQNGQTVPEIRFVGFTDAWEQRKLNEIADKVSEKNKNNEFSEPFTNSAEQGIISQKDYFDREIVNDENLNGYYIVRNDDFIYNPRISVTAPVGPINRNRLGRNGVISPLYTVFRTHDIDNLYLEFYFKTTKWHRFMKLNGDSGARFDRFTISSTQFMEMPIPYPTLEEQRKIGVYFESLDTLITLHHRKYIYILKSP